MDPVSSIAPAGPAFLQPAFHVGVLLPSGPRAGADATDLWAKIDETIETFSRELRQFDDMRRRGRDGYAGSTFSLRFIALEPGIAAKKFSAMVEGRGWSCLALQLDPGLNCGDLPARPDTFVVESSVEHEAEDRIALQTVFLDQVDVLIDFDEADHSLATAVLLRTARLGSVPVWTAGQIFAAVVGSTTDDTSPIRNAFLKASSLGDIEAKVDTQLREADAFLKLTRDAERNRRPDSSGQSSMAIVQARLATTLAHADEVAGRYGSRSRSIGMLRVLLGAIATLGVFFAFYFADVMRSFWTGPTRAAQQVDLHALETAGYGVDVLAIIAVLALAAIEKRRPWSRRFAAARYVAEHLRHMPAMATLGNTVTRLRVASPGTAAPQDWPRWYLRRVARSVGCPAGTLTAEDRGIIRREFDAQVEEQVLFYQRRARRFSRLARDLSRLANGCYALGLAAVLLRLAVFAQIEPDTRVQMIASLGTFVFPALGSVFVALCAQGEYVKLSKRYDATAAVLRDTLRADAPEKSFAGLMDYVRGTVSAMLDEVAEWHVLLRSHTISPL